jgi:hypothetical protein
MVNALMVNACAPCVPEADFREIFRAALIPRLQKSVKHIRNLSNAERCIFPVPARVSIEISQQINDTAPLNLCRSLATMLPEQERWHSCQIRRKT